MIALSHPFCVCFFVTNVYDKHIFMSCQNLLTHTSGGFQCQNDFIKVDFSQNDNLEFLILESNPKQVSELMQTEDSLANQSGLRFFSINQKKVLNH